MENYILDLWINSDTKTDSRLVIGDKVASILLQLKKETNAKTTDLLKTKYTDIIEFINKPNSYILKHTQHKGFVKKYYYISTELKYKINTYNEWIKFKYGYFGNDLFHNPINNKLYSREFIYRRLNKKRLKIDTIKSIKTYIIKDNKNNTYKIGKSKNPLKREKTLQSEKPNLKLIKIFENNIEKKLHNLYKDCRLRGEWFNLNKVQVEYICKKYK